MRRHLGRIPLHHVDAYRLAGAEELEELDILDSTAVIVIEWGDRIDEALPDSAGLIEIQHLYQFIIWHCAHFLP